MTRAALVLLWGLAACSESGVSAPPEPGKLTGASGEVLPALEPGPKFEMLAVDVRNGGLLIRNRDGLVTESTVGTLCDDLRTLRSQLREPYPGDLPTSVALRQWSPADLPAVLTAVEALKGCGIEHVGVNVMPQSQSLPSSSEP